MSKREHNKAEKAAFDYQKAQLAITNIEAEKKAKYAAIDSEYAVELEKAQATAKDCEETLMAYAKKNGEDLFTGKAKMVPFGPIKLGFKLNPAKVGFLEGFDEKVVLEKVKKYLPGYVRQSYSLDKNKLKADAEELGTKLKKCGLEIVQEEKFELKL